MTTEDVSVSPGEDMLNFQKQIHTLFRFSFAVLSQPGLDQILWISNFNANWRCEFLTRGWGSIFSSKTNLHSLYVCHLQLLTAEDMAKTSTTTTIPTFAENVSFCSERKRNRFVIFSPSSINYLFLVAGCFCSRIDDCSVANGLARPCHHILVCFGYSLLFLSLSSIIVTKCWSSCLLWK